MKKSLRHALSCLTLLLAGAAAAAEAADKPEPVFPAGAPGLIYIEGEDAVSTNFAREASLDYASSGLRILQLNQAPQAAGAPFFAEYAFVADEAGVYELWLGGTPPGPRDELSPSYVSPLQYRLDGGPVAPVYREGVQVRQGYSLTSSWYRLKETVKLDAGVHTLRIEIAEKRRYDLRYYFALDALFLLKTDTAGLPPETLPAKFPATRDDTAADKPYLTLAVYETAIQAQPKEPGPYLELAKVYALVGDYPNALKVLNRARINLGDIPEVLLLMAKSRIWSGEFDEGLKLYREYLKQNQKDLAVWAEAAKVIAWLGQYPASLELYQEALRLFPDDLNLLVNEGLTLLWANRIAEGGALLDKAWELAKADATAIRRLGTIYLVNGYPDKTVETWRKAIAAYPGNLEFLMLLQDSLLRQGQAKDAAAVTATIRDSFRPSERLDALLQAAALKATIKQNTLDAIQARLAASPDDLKLRDELVKAYFWNGRRAEAIAESRNILVNKLYRQFQDLDAALRDESLILDRAYLQANWLAGAAARISTVGARLQDAQSRWKAADAQVKQWEKDGKQPDKLTAAQDARLLALAELASQSAEARQVLETAQASATILESLAPAAQEAVARSLEERKNLAKLQPWYWDRAATMAELAGASTAGNHLADWLMARIALFERQPQAASAAVHRLELTAAPPAAFAPLQAQARLWLGPFEGLDPALQATLLPPLEGPTDYGDDTPRQAADHQAALTQLAKDLPKRQTQAQELIGRLHERLLSRMRLQFYQFDLDSSNERAQIADYYLSLNRNAEARDQLDLVLRVAPANLAARFNLGRARQLSGDWSGAMVLYRDVWQSDPKYENTASLFNQLAKAHADRIESQVASAWDNARQSTKARVGFQAGGSTNLGFGAAYTLDTVRLIKAIGINDPVTISLHSLDMSVPLKLPEAGLEFYAKAGGTLKDKHASSWFAADTTPAMADFFDHFVVAPLLGAGASWTTGPLILAGSYTFDQLPDSFFPLRATTYEHRGDLSATLFFEIPDSPFFRSVGSRSLLKAVSAFEPFDPATGLAWASAPPQSNFLWAAAQDLTLNFLLAANPWTIMVASGNFSWEDSTDPAASAYYSPSQVLSAKGGLQFASWIGMGEGWVLGLSLRGNAGVNDAPANTPARTFFQFDAGFRAELSKGDMAVFLDLSANRASAGAEERYWAVNLNLGLNLAFPGYIAP
jgi:Flp pilus assembly protein TadD